MSQPEYPGIYLYKRIVQAKLYIDANYAADIDLDNISGEAHFSKFHFVRLFKRTYGRTPHRYLVHIRLEHARLFLKAGRDVSEVCYAVGFESVSSFSGLFKRITGLTPSVWQARERRLLADVAEAPLKYVPGCFAGTI